MAGMGLSNNSETDLSTNLILSFADLLFLKYKEGGILSKGTT